MRKACRVNWKQVASRIPTSSQTITKVDGRTRSVLVTLKDPADVNYVYLYQQRLLKSFVVFSVLPSGQKTSVFGEIQHAVDYVNELLVPYTL